MTIIDPLLTPRRARRITVRALLNEVLLLLALPGTLLLPPPLNYFVPLALAVAQVRGGRSVEVWDAIERPTKRVRRRGVESTEYVRFWSAQANWPVERVLRLRLVLRVVTVLAFPAVGAALIYGQVTGRGWLWP